MQLKDIPTNSVRIKEILASPERLKNVQQYCAIVDAIGTEKTLFRRGFSDDHYRELKLDASVIKKHLQNIDNSGAGFVKYTETQGFFLIEYI